MLFRQLFDRESCTYTYLVAASTGEALIIDPVLEHTEQYLRLLAELDLQLKFTFDTHVHADHVTASGLLAEKTGASIVMGEKSKAQGITPLKDGEVLSVGDLKFTVLYTPGHTDDSYCLLMSDRVFTGDTLFIRGTGRTDFQHGSSAEAYQSIIEKLLTLPGETLVYPGHDYKGMTVSTISEEKRFNPRLQINSAAEYAAIMDNLNLPKPNKIDIAVPANLHCGLSTSGMTE